MSPVLFPVLRRCQPGECEPDCNCHVVTVDVEVDELAAEEVADFQEHGNIEQRAEIVAHFAEEPVPASGVQKRAA